MYRSLNARLSTRGVDDDICTKSQIALLDQVLGVLLCAHSLALEASVCGVLERKVEALVVDVDGDDLLRSVCFRNSTAQQTNRTSTEHDNRVSRLDGSLPCDVNSDSSRLNKRTLLHAHVLRQLEAVVLRQGVVPCQRTIIWRCRRKRHIRAKIVLALLAAYAATTGDTRLHSDLVTDLQALDLVANLVYDACGFVTEHHGLLNYEVADAAFDPVVNV
jgi:hypothetical protein